MSKDQNIITRLKCVPVFDRAVECLIKGDELSNEYSSVLLLSAIALSRTYQDDRTKKQSIEFAYWIILNYSLNTGDMRPLLEFSFGFGLYPICKVISKMKKLTDSKTSLIEELAYETIDELFTNGTVVATAEQANRRNSFLQERNSDIAYIAPTSFGKTHQLLERAISEISGSKVCIIVPTKSLLNQTKNDIKGFGLSFKLISHDEMYSSEDDNFIAVLTQERAMRILDNNPVLSFDTIFVDEAHRLFEGGDRTILLTRVIRECRNRNSCLGVVYLSPVVSDANHFSFISGKEVKELRIDFSMKEPKYYYFDADNILYLYNRFFDKFTSVGLYSEFWECIINCSSDKNLIYTNSPRSIVSVAKSLSARLPEVELTSEFEVTVSCLRKHVHYDYDEVECLKHGVVYLHGRIPEGIKEYLVSKIAMLKQIKYIVANTVILEGLNLPIQSIFILNGKNLRDTNLVNLIGRAARLNDVFSDSPNLNRLRPEIYFVESKYNATNLKMKNLIKRIRSSAPRDRIDNPILKYLEGIPLGEPEIEKVRIEEFIFNKHDDYLDLLKDTLYRSGIYSYYNFTDEVVRIINSNLLILKRKTTDLLDAVWEVFIKDLEDYLQDTSIVRLKHPGTRMYYRNFITDRNARTLSERIARSVAVFQGKSRQTNIEDRLEFVGKSFGDLDKNGLRDGQLSFVDLYGKTISQLVSYSIIKLGLEDDFLRYKVSRFVRLLKRQELLDEKQYNLFVYGVDSRAEIELVKMGIPLSIVRFIGDNGNLQSLERDSYGNILIHSVLDERNYLFDDYNKFEMNRTVL